tara:strand:- start:463 stop:2133 length:1671 start_codon:yes stop_codon:yes gene_type:complete
MTKVNIITLNNQYSKSTDVLVLYQTLVRIFRNSLEIEEINVANPKRSKKYVDLNIFFNEIDYLSLNYAPLNIFFFSKDHFLPIWVPFLKRCQYIICKTKYDVKYLKLQGIDTSKLIYLSWNSLDIFNNTYVDSNNKKNQIFVSINNSQNNYNIITQIINNWQLNHPQLIVLYYSQNYTFPEKKNITYINKYLDHTALLKIKNESKYHLILNTSNTFNYSLYECLSCKSIPIIKYLNINYFIKEENIGYTFKDIPSLVNLLDYIPTNNYNICQFNSSRSYYLKQSKIFIELFESEFKSILSDNQSLFKKTREYTNSSKIAEIKNYIITNLPPITIITPTKNRPKLFKIALYNIKNINYPLDKLEWIIVETGNQYINQDDIEELKTKKYNIKYYNLPSETPLYEARNYAIQHSTHSLISCMDDDDYYPMNHLKYRIYELLRGPNKPNCVYSTILGCFDIQEKSSIIEIPDIQLPLDKRIALSSLLFYKSFWENKPFTEKNDFLEGREDQTKEISYQGSLVGLLHSNNNFKKSELPKESNGCHFNWSDDLFKFITTIFD